MPSRSTQSLAMREYLSRGAAFLAGFVVSGYMFDVVWKSLSPYGWGAFQLGDHLATLLVSVAWVVPTSVLGFWKARRAQISLSQAGLLGAGYWALVAATADHVGRLNLGLAVGIPYLLLGPLLTSWFGGLAIGRRQAHG